MLFSVFCLVAFLSVCLSHSLRHECFCLFVLVSLQVRVCVPGGVSLVLSLVVVLFLYGVVMAVLMMSMLRCFPPHSSTLMMSLFVLLQPHDPLPLFLFCSSFPLPSAA